MDIDCILTAISKLVKSLNAASEVERLQSYSAIQTLRNQLLAYVAEKNVDGDSIGKNNAKIYFTELDSHLRPMVGLEDTSHPYEQQELWARQCIDKLRSVHCFDIPGYE
jgi:hypothetical protein